MSSVSFPTGKQEASMEADSADRSKRRLPEEVIVLYDPQSPAKIRKILENSLLEQIAQKFTEVVVPWIPRAFDRKTAVVHMFKNAQKAIQEHRDQDDSEVYASVEKGLLEPFPRGLPPLKFEHNESSEQGKRLSMEDAHFFREIERGAILAVLDGHGSEEDLSNPGKAKGASIANYASQRLQEELPLALANRDVSVHSTFESVIDKIHSEIIQRKEWDEAGATLVLSFIDKTTHFIYTATVGDSEANIYRTFGDQLKSIPLSCIRNWGSKKDAKRASILLGTPITATLWPLMPNPKTLRVPPRGSNVSRSLGDSCNKMPLIIPKPKISINRVKPGDVLVLACDGLKDFSLERDIVKTVHASSNLFSTLSASLVKRAMDDYSRDNVTVVAVKIS
ncbi:MAG: protein serine/threonine phosphatase 2C family protein [Verrucomicrobiota bacterium]|nr:protein serine/threonine phosphatase 2C family protein [Verrucomicrobiota bacterium]